jgi:DNA (cytosine-5)-methyltransferase 1
MYNLIDLFCGAGGFAKGFEMTGRFKCLGGIDNVLPAIETHRKNFPESVSVCRDIREIEPASFNKMLKGQEVDVIIGGPPCPTFSTIGHAKIQSIHRPKGNDITKDPRNILFLEFIRFVKYFKPKYFVMENVPQFLTKYKGENFKIAKEIFNRELLEYEIVEPVLVLNSVNYGVPQNRRRMMLVGHLKCYGFEYPKISHWHKNGKFNINPFNQNSDKLLPHVSVKAAIEDLPLITDNWRVSECRYSIKKPKESYQIKMREKTGLTVANSICRMSNERAKKVFGHMKEGSIYMDLPEKVRKVLPFREDIFRDRLKRLVSSEPSWTVLAHIGMDGYMYIHPWENRTLSVREAARIQSFPDDFIFIGNQQETYVQVGNAVPPLMGKAIAEQIYKGLKTKV